MKKPDQYFRVDNYVTDGFFLMKKELEKPYMKKWVAKAGTPQVETLIDGVNKSTDYVPVHAIKSSNLMADRATLELTDIERTTKVVIDIKFRDLFPGDCAMFIRNDRSPVVLRSPENDELLGLIMPLRIE